MAEIVEISAINTIVNRPIFAYRAQQRHRQKRRKFLKEKYPHLPLFQIYPVIYLG